MNNKYELIQGNFLRKTAKLLYVSSAKYGGDWHSVQHTHNCSELFYVIEGQGQFLIENQTYPVSVNDLVIVNPNVLHTEVSLNASPLRYIVLGVEGLEPPRETTLASSTFPNRGRDDEESNNLSRYVCKEYDEPAQHISIILTGAQYRREPNLYLSILDNPIKSQLPIYKNSHFL